MKPLYAFPVILLVLALHSCTIEKRVHSRGFHVEWPGAKRSRHETARRHTSYRRLHTLPRHSETSAVFAQRQAVTGTVQLQSRQAVQAETMIRKSAAGKTPCDLIVLQSGEEISAQVYEVGATEIRYKKCGTPEGAYYHISRKNVQMIRYGNGVKELFGNDQGSDSVPQPYPGQDHQTLRTVPGSSVAAFVLALSAPFLFLTAIPAFFIGISSLKKINRNPELYRGRGFSIAAIVISSGYLLFFIVFILFFLFMIGLLFSGRTGP